MMRQVVMAAALAGGIFLVPALHPSAEAAVVGANAGLDKPSGITMIRRGGGGGGGGGGKSFGGGGGKSFGGGGMGRSYAGGGSRMSHKSFGGHRMGNKNYNGHRSYHKGHAHRRHHRHNRFFVTGVPYYGYYYDGYYGYDDDCNWLRRRAIRTGSSYWWNRYYACQGY